MIGAENLKASLKTFLKGEVADDEKILAEYSRDAGFFSVRPRLVVFPRDVDDVKALVSFVSREKPASPDLSLTARSGGSDMSGGPINESIIVSFTKHLNRVKEVGIDFVTAEPGVYYRDLEKETLKKGLIFASYPASRELCAIGGLIANNAGGEKSLRYGKTAEHVRRIKAVLRDGNEYVFEKISAGGLENKKRAPGLEGEIYRRTAELMEAHYDRIKAAKPKVSKNSAGYNIFDVWDRRNFNLAKLFTGSQGTLGLVTEATLGLVPKLKHSKLLVIFLNDLKLLPDIVNTVLEYQPESFEAYDRHTFALAMKFLPEIVAKMGRNIFLFLRFLPEFWMMLTHGVPELIIMPEFAGDDLNEIDEKIAAVKTKLARLNLKMRVAASPAAVEKYFAVRRESFNLLRQKIKDRQTAPFIDDWCVLPEKLPEFLPALNKILAKYPQLIYTVAGHIGDGNFHIIPLMNLNNPAERAIIKPLSDEVFALVGKFGGTITAEHNDGLIRSPYLRKMYGEDIYRIFEEVKKIYDPQNIFNPGKKVNSDINYALAHIKAK